MQKGGAKKKMIVQIENDVDLFFVCSLIDFIGRQTKNDRKVIVNKIGEDGIRHIYNFADVLHSENIEEVADRIINQYNIKNGEFDNVAECEYHIPTFWDIGKVYMRLIIMIGGDRVRTLIDIYNSWIADKINNYNIAVYFMSPEYIYECYKQGEILGD